ncbi:hypothetical protein [Thiothrix winogradskyi]|uniref:C2H2-type domain-containing protein n=1 Tax=Thiothrix winogradskyi TaxID=96472 RepID=A0ABY3T352_9GAMM|nr:hypothetical protein [Thiothrix winogradskyi]UJS26286.1 hypothetical protein L2Y54_09665 [Thiothrix winogradskyi]
MACQFAVVACRPRVARVVQGCGYRAGYNRHHMALLPVHEVRQETEAYQILPAYPAQFAQDCVVADYRSCQRCGQVVTGADCGCSSHGQHAHPHQTRYGFRSAF